MERHIIDERYDPTFEYRMQRIVKMPISRLREESPGVWSEPFVEGQEVAGDVTRWAARIRHASDEYRKMLVFPSDLTAGRALVFHRLDKVKLLKPYRRNVLDALMTNPHWEHGDIHRENILATRTGIAILDHEWMAATSREWASIPMLTGFTATPWPVRWEMVGGVDPYLMALAYAARFPLTTEAGAPRHAQLTAIIKNVLGTLGFVPSTFREPPSPLKSLTVTRLSIEHITERIEQIRDATSAAQA